MLLVHQNYCLQGITFEKNLNFLYCTVLIFDYLLRANLTLANYGNILWIWSNPISKPICAWYIPDSGLFTFKFSYLFTCDIYKLFVLTFQYKYFSILGKSSSKSNSGSQWRNQYTKVFASKNSYLFTYICKP